MDQESLKFDVLIIGAGPAGLSAGIRLKQLCLQHSIDLSICIIEKGAEVGAHILSGAVLEPTALNELIPDWKSKEAPLHTKAKYDQFFYLTKNKAYHLPTPMQMRNEGNYIISLGLFCRWLKQQAEQLGIDVYPGFAASKILYNDSGQVIGVSIGDMGIDKDGQPTQQYQAGLKLFAKQTLFSEGCRGHLSQQLMQRFDLRNGVQPQTYAIGIKELWKVATKHHKPGTVIHSVGWPLDQQTYGGSFLYHLENNQIAIGFVIGLDYRNPWLNPFAEFQRFKTHPSICPVLSDGERIAYGARALNEGGYQSIPKLTFPGGAIIGDAAGFINVPKIKGIHTAMKSAMIAAESVFTHLQQKQNHEICTYTKNLRQSWLWKELYRVRNIRPGFHWGLWPGLAYAAIDTYLLHGKAPWTFGHYHDNQRLQKAKKCKKIHYPAPDNKITFDILSSLYLANINHPENQPCHLLLKDTNQPIIVNLKDYAAPEQRYCPANVYEIIGIESKQPQLQINAQNCLHCKVCDIKDSNITWVPPEGGSGPNYEEM